MKRFNLWRSRALWRSREKRAYRKWRKAVKLGYGHAKRQPLYEAYVHAREQRVKRDRQIRKRRNPTHISEKGLDFIKGFEGFSATQYDDGVGVKTIGYGTTAADIQPLPKRITKAKAEELLRERIDRKYAPAVREAMKRWRLKLNQNQFDALTSFAYNLGENCFLGQPGFESLGRALKSRDKNRIADTLLLYDNPNDPNVHEGLARRRRSERALFLS